MPQSLAATLPYTPPGLARALLAEPTLVPLVEQFPAAVLFSDISGFTALTEKLSQRGAEGPEEITRLLNAYFSRLIAAIEGEGGEVVKFSGDAMTVLFPAATEPVGHAARRVVQAAAAMHAFTGDFAAVPTSAGPCALSVKIGAGVGTIHAFRVGGVLERWEYVIAGDPLRQLADAEHHGKPGETVLSPEIAALLADPATPAALPSRPLQAPPIADCADPQAAAIALRGFVPGALRAWLGADVQEWVAALRPMSVLFITVNDLDYAAANALERLQSFLTSAQEVIYRYEGSINKLVVDDKGTVLLAMIGAPPLAHADDAVRGALAGLDLLKMAQAQGLAMAVGVATGPVFAGPLGSASRREYTVMGDTVNRAARLMAAAGVGDIRCDFTTAHEAGRMLAFDTLPAVHMKGKTGLIPVYRPLGPLTQPQEQAGAILVGRQTERARLRAALDDLRAGRQRVLLIEGEAGLGKSRLKDELVHLCRAGNLTTLAGAGHSSERRTPYRAWRDVFRAYFALEGVNDPAEYRRLVQAHIAEIAPEFIERLPLLNDILGTAFPETPLTATLEAERRHHGREALLIELLRRWAAAHPLVLILEDAHWMDMRSWGLTAAIVSGLAAARAPLLMVLTLRPIERSNRPPELDVLAALDGAEQLTLAALDPAETAALAAVRLGLTARTLPPALEALVCARADGNPFFAEEIVLTLCDRGLLEITGEADQRCCVIHGDLAAAGSELPDTIQGVILSRIDLLAPDVQMLLRVGSVIGRSFPFTTLRASLSPYLPVADTDLKLYLEDLAGQNFTPQEAPDPDLRYAFKHAITREVAYGTLLFSQRRELHRTVAQWYEARYAQDDGRTGGGDNAAAPVHAKVEIVHLLAYHYQQAGDAQRERHYAALAGELAMGAYANTEALAYLNRALELTPPEDRAERRRLVLSREQVYDACAERAAQAADIATLSALSDPQDARAQAEVALRRANYELATDDFPSAANSAEHAVTLAHAIDWQEGEAIAQRIRGAALIPVARYDDARAQLGTALELARKIDLAGTEDDCLRDLGLIAYELSDYVTALRCYEQALAIDRTIGDRRGESATLVRLGNVSRELGDDVAALSFYQQAVMLDRATGDRDDEADGLRGIGTIAYDQGDYVAARTAYTESLAIERTTGDREGEAACLAALGMAARATGDFASAQESLDEALAINRAIGDRYHEAAVRADLALLCHQRGNNEAAREHAEASVQLARSLGARYIEGTALTRLGHALDGLADGRGAEAAYEASLQLHQALGAHTLALEPLAGLARIALANGNLAAAQTRADNLIVALEAGVNAWSDELPDIFLSCYRVLHAAGDMRAVRLLDIACARLERQAGQITDTASRQTFWADVPAHRALLAARTA